MAHHKLREENNCLNCGAEVHTRFCTVCGQENRDHRISAFGLIAHFIGDLLHFDGKFFTTLRRLFFKPGQLPKEYVEGKRKKNVDPIKMYIFTSAIFFSLFFLFFNTEKSMDFNWTLDEIQKDSAIIKITEKLKADPDSEILLKQLEFLSDSLKTVALNNKADTSVDLSVINFTSERYSSKNNYDSIQNTLTIKQRDGWIMKKLHYKEIELNEKFRNEGTKALKTFASVFLHKIPILLFISLPLFALSLKFLYIRRKKFFYVDHGIFSLYQYVYSLAIFFLMLALSKLNDVLQSGIIKFLIYSLAVYWFYYLYRALRVFYLQGRWKTILKMMLLFFFGFMINIFLFVIFIFFSVFQI